MYVFSLSASVSRRWLTIPFADDATGDAGTGAGADAFAIECDVCLHLIGVTLMVRVRARVCGKNTQQRERQRKRAAACKHRTTITSHNNLPGPNGKRTTNGDDSIFQHVVYIFRKLWRLIIQEFFNLIGDLPYYYLIAVRKYFDVMCVRANIRRSSLCAAHRERNDEEIRDKCFYKFTFYVFGFCCVIFNIQSINRAIKVNNRRSWRTAFGSLSLLSSIYIFRQFPIHLRILDAIESIFPIGFFVVLPPISPI